MAIILVITTEDGQETELLILDRIIIGRSSNSDYKIADAKLSGLHCSFEINRKGQLVFTDLESTNGSFLNSIQVDKSIIRVNDTIRIGSTDVKINEERLTVTERLEIGVSLPLKDKEKVLPKTRVISRSPLPPPVPAEKTIVENEEVPVKKKTVLLNKQHKEKQKIVPNWSGSENVIDQESSSGTTKLLELNKDKKKK